MLHQTAKSENEGYMAEKILTIKITDKTEYPTKEICSAFNKVTEIILDLSELNNTETEKEIFDFLRDYYCTEISAIKEKVYLTEKLELKRLIAIGDIHGEIDRLNNLLKKLNPTKQDRIVFLGDYIDRGKDSVAVIDRLLKLKEQTNCNFLEGNHEQLFLKALSTLSEEDVANCMLNGGAKTLQDYLLMKKDNFEKFKIHMKFFRSLEMIYIKDFFVFVHAGINPFKTLTQQSNEDLIWIRDEFINNKLKIAKWGYKVIFGHTVCNEPFVSDDKIGINTGCGVVENALLTAYICNENKFVFSD